MNFVEDWTTKAGQFTSGLLQRVTSIPSDVALYVSCLPAIEQKVLYPCYQAFLQNHKPNLPKLAGQDLEIAQELAAKGICITSLDALNLPCTENFLDAAQTLSDELAQMAELPKYKGKHTLTATAEQLIRPSRHFSVGRAGTIASNRRTLPEVTGSLRWIILLLQYCQWPRSRPP